VHPVDAEAGIPNFEKKKNYVSGEILFEVLAAGVTHF
jgi:hypothetical protein